jgi:hypothetical protein
MTAALRLIAQSGGAETWLARHGLAEVELEQLHARLVE